VYKSASTTVSVVVDWCVGDMGRMMGSAGLVYDCVETVVVIGGVRDFACGAVRFDQAVFTLDNITVSLFPLILDITGMVVLHAVVERVLGWRLQYRSSAIVVAIPSLGHEKKDTIILYVLL